MSKCSNWNAIIHKFSSKLFYWKAGLLSVGGRLSLIKLVLGNLPTYYMSIYMMSVVVRENLKSMRNKFFIVSDQDEKKDDMGEMEEMFSEQESWRSWRYPKGGAESSQFDSLQAAIENVALSDQCDSWQWSLDVSVGYSVVSVRALVDAYTLDVHTVATRWNMCIPIKVNVNLWRLNLNKLPSRVNLD
ncbi:hypothetical protein Tco_0145932 [Tanacetum coccineum]